MKRTVILAITLSSLLVSFGCGEKAKRNLEEASGAEASPYVHLTASQLEFLGIIVSDSTILYSNKVEGIGELNIKIRNKEYSRGSSEKPTHNLGFYPRYITTLDTVQRAMYMLSGSEEETRKWQSFENLVPIVVEQKAGETEFGETLIFWMTKTPELEKLLKELR